MTALTAPQRRLLLAIRYGKRVERLWPDLNASLRGIFAEVEKASAQWDDPRAVLTPAGLAEAAKIEQEEKTNAQ